MSDRYEYHDICEKTKQYLIDNFNEDPLIVNQHIDSLRQWVVSMPHLNCPTDSKFLLRFLRKAKFDLERAKQLVDNCCTIRRSERGSHHFFHRHLVDEALIEEFLDSQVYTFLGKSAESELLILFMMKNWDPDKIPRDSWSTMIFMSHDVVLAQNAEIHGVRILVDLSGASKKVAKQWADGDYIKHATSVLQDAYPWRFNGVIIYGAPKVFGPFSKMWEFYKNNEPDNDFIQIKKDEHHEFDNIPGLRNLLPTECGGLAGPLKSISERWKQQFKEFYKHGDPTVIDHVDESKRHPETSDYFKGYPKYHGACYDTDCSDG